MAIQSQLTLATDPFRSPFFCWASPALQLPQLQSMSCAPNPRQHNQRRTKLHPRPILMARTTTNNIILPCVESQNTLRVSTGSLRACCYQGVRMQTKLGCPIHMVILVLSSGRALFARSHSFDFGPSFVLQYREAPQRRHVSVSFLSHEQAICNVVRSIRLLYHHCPPPGTGVRHTVPSAPSDFNT